MPDERLAFQKCDHDLAVEIWERQGGGCTTRRIELLRRYKQGGEWHVTNHLGHGNHHRGALLLKEAKDWIKEQGKAEGGEREANKPQEPIPYGVEPAGARFKRLAVERRKAAGVAR